VSDGVAAGRRQDLSGAAITEWAAARGYRVAARDVVPDDTPAIAARLVAWADAGEVDVILTTGGTGLSARDRTPEATRAALDKEAPGIAEVLRSAGAARVRRAALSRGAAGTRGSALIVNLPGSVAGVKDCLTALEPLVEHTVELLQGKTEHT
jgi:molybdenum cofactor synthesis domain-containing protein